MPESEGLPAPPGSADNVANVEGRELAPPSAGFGQLWWKELSVTLPSAPAAEELMRYWQEHLDDLWPERGTLHRDRAHVRAGDLLGIDLSVGPVTLSTGVVVTESAPTRFTVLAPQGHAFSGWTRFETEEWPDGTRAIITIEMRASDPLFELGLMFGGHRTEERFWADMLRNLGERFGDAPKVRLIRRRLDGHRQWRRAGNVRHNATIRTTFRRLTRPLRKSN